jgi:predicted TIM-barrel fold metal-dependent hydrolase
VNINGVEIFNKISDAMLADFERLTNKYYGEYVAMGFNPESQVKAMKQLGIAVSFLYPTFGLNMTSIDTLDPQLAGALTRAYNNWLRDFCSYDPQMLRGVGAINRHDPTEMVTELRRVAAFGWRGVCLRPNPVKGRLLSDPAYEPFWTEGERLGINVGLHEGTHCRLPATGADRFNPRFALLMHALLELRTPTKDFYRPSA